MTIPEDTLAWLRQAAAAGQADAQVMQELLRRVEALEQRPIAGDHELAPATEDSSVTAPPDAEEPQTLHSVALRMVDTLARLGVIPEILVTLRRAIREPMAPAAEPIDEAENDRRFKACMAAIDAAPPLIVPDTRRPGASMQLLTMRLPPALVADLDELAARLGCSRVALIRTLLTQGVAQLKEVLPVEQEADR
jgi:hypothetical protein